MPPGRTALSKLKIPKNLAAAIFYGILNDVENVSLIIKRGLEKKIQIWTLQFLFSNSRLGYLTYLINFFGEGIVNNYGGI